MQTIARNGIDQSRKFAVLVRTARNDSYVYATYETEEAAAKVARFFSDAGGRVARIAD